MTLIHFATCEAIPNLTEDDRLLLRPLAERGIQVKPAVWSDPKYPWQDCDAVLIRSCWDYHLRTGEFLRWIGFLESQGCRLWNPATMIRWNADKGYLRSLEAQDIPIVPTLWFEPGESASFGERLRQSGWGKAVIKPRISATAYRTTVVVTGEASGAQALFEELLHGPGVMVQKFMGNILTEGEWSLIFFAGQFSHAVIKTPKAGDFRVQHDFGGRTRAADPPPAVLASAARAVQAAGFALYARVDGVVERDPDRGPEKDMFRVMELELIEPSLFLADHSAAPERFADAIAAVMRSARPEDPVRR
jgi:glutathione synthase/RimK-type ligase-like ATP-grasp enzyme